MLVPVSTEPDADHYRPGHAGQSYAQECVAEPWSPGGLGPGEHGAIEDEEEPEQDERDDNAFVPAQSNPSGGKIGQFRFDGLQPPAGIAVSASRVSGREFRPDDWWGGPRLGRPRTFDPTLATLALGRRGRTGETWREVARALETNAGTLRNRCAEYARHAHKTPRCSPPQAGPTSASIERMERMPSEHCAHPSDPVRCSGGWTPATDRASDALAHHSQPGHVRSRAVHGLGRPSGCERSGTLARSKVGCVPADTGKHGGGRPYAGGRTRRC